MRTLNERASYCVIKSADRACLNVREEILLLTTQGSPHLKRRSRTSLASFTMEKHMTKVTFLSAALLAAALFTTQAMAAGSNVAARGATTTAHARVTDCVRAPDVGAFASDPYNVPPCEPNTTY